MRAGTRSQGAADRTSARHCTVRPWGETVLVADLIPHMLAQFILRDKAFKAVMRRERSRTVRPQSLDQPRLRALWMSYGWAVIRRSEPTRLRI